MAADNAAELAPRVPAKSGSRVDAAPGFLGQAAGRVNMGRRSALAQARRRNPPACVIGK